MHLSIATTLAWQLPGPADMLLQVEVASDDEQRVIQSRLDCDRPADLTRIPALDGIGERIWVHREGGPFRVEYMAEVEVQRIVPDPAMLLALPLHRLPGAAVPYLMDSSYCPPAVSAPS